MTGPDDAIGEDIASGEPAGGDAASGDVRGEDFAARMASIRAQAKQAVDSAKLEVEAADEVVDSAARERFRGTIATIIIYLFSTVILAAVIFALTQNSDSTAGQIDNLLESYVYPVVLLVLGFYFGARQAEADEATGS